MLMMPGSERGKKNNGGKRERNLSLHACLSVGSSTAGRGEMCRHAPVFQTRTRRSERSFFMPFYGRRCLAETNNCSIGWISEAGKIERQGRSVWVFHSVLFWIGNFKISPLVPWTGLLSVVELECITNRCQSMWLILIHVVFPPCSKHFKLYYFSRDHLACVARVNDLGKK